ncbi:PD-(D/E)XK nuclease family protein [Aureitalea marina]|uniref:PD-(D/E)XK endonuclease-like domain-containing protein n=1 Tax=Aureitalea marina TaxID=930804 RepID=A0A2S7KRY3_9FLAO|nr:PD-(D/E)XK nuclease family protein [Aureitalea marina]PQB05367.1 hypothetical protein BST85_11065 [Aureitalea marina]
MPSFLQDVVDQTLQLYHNWEDLIFVLPSKRAGNFLKQEIRSRYQQTGFAPTILSIEDFIQHVADLKLIDPTVLNYRAYQAYLTLENPPKKESFEQFSGWAPALISDLNEMDRYCLDTTSFFSNLSSIKAMERWNLEEESTEFVNNYMAFWQSIPSLYENLTSTLLSEKTGYQGLIYRKASEDIEHYINANLDKPHIFMGFNALNTSEQIIITELLQHNMGHIFWDMDQYFLDRKEHMATSFFRKYQLEWNFYQDKEPEVLHRSFEEPKSIRLNKSETHLGQVYQVAQILSQLSPDEIRSTAVVLADEQLLMPLLHAIPKEIDQINVTMGAPLSIFPITDLFRLLLLIQQQNSASLYHKHLDALLNHSAISSFLKNTDRLNQKIKEQNLAYVQLDSLLQWSDPLDVDTLQLMLSPWKETTSALDSCLELLEILRLNAPPGEIIRTSAYGLYRLFLHLKHLDEELSYLKEISGLHKLFLELARTRQIDFESNAFQGLQVMGLLETRCLDFERVLLLSVNEGILPSGKSQSSFLTYDLKKEYELPTQYEKDAVYAYHFYRLLFRAKEVDLFYVEQTEGLGSMEKSRFLRQLELDPPTQHHIEHLQLTTSIDIKPPEPKQVEKSSSLNLRLEEIARKGFSPSSLTNYIRNPLEFYAQRVLRIRELEEVEETVAYNTLGNVVHNSLENLYKPWIGRQLEPRGLTDMLSRVTPEVKTQFEQCFKQGDTDQGMNLIIYQVAIRYVEQLIKADIALLNKGNNLEIVSLEEELEMELNLPHITYPVRIYGKADRIDLFNGDIRIVDYKTGAVEPADLKVKEWAELIEDYKYAKAFQVLCYALMLKEKKGILANTSGIISFKRMSYDFMPFKDSTGSSTITDQILTQYEEVLQQLIAEIMDKDIHFVEKQVH